MGPFVIRCVRASLLAFALALVPAATAGAASLWTPVATNTTQNITGVAAPHAGELILVTSGGSISYMDGAGTFQAASVTPADPLGFTDVAMSADGANGVAIGDGGAMYRSTDAGHSWTKDASPTELTGECPTPGATTTPLSDNLDSVKWSDSTTVYVTGANDDVLKSVNGGLTFTEVNKSPSACVANPGGGGSAFTDMAWVSPTVGYFLSNDFGAYYRTTDGFASASHVGDAVNGFTGIDRLAIDPGSPNRAWATNEGLGTTYFQASTDGGTDWADPDYDGNQKSFQDVAFGGGTVVVVGTEGDIYTSPDGVHFFRQIAAPPFAANNWNTTAVLSTTTAYVGGDNGVLLVTAQANQVPDSTAPTGSISGPSTLSVGQFGTYTAHVTDNAGGSGVDPTGYSWSAPDNPARTGATATFAFQHTGPQTIVLTFRDLAGNTNTATFTVQVGSSAGNSPTGSNPSTHKAGGSKITIFKTVTVTGTSGRFIPVKLATKKPRKFVITLVTLAKHSKKLAHMTVTLKKGKKTVHLKIGKTVKPGTYRLQVQVFTTGKHSHKVGKRVKQVFVLK
ncbi:MAG TPA: hypothetical protein VGI87_05910 [Solirubrobacteraceae bacterium]|jgi:photosystem II stability/assembly factor-like uncharacterized protein